MKISTKISAAFGAVVLMFIAVSIVLVISNQVGDKHQEAVRRDIAQLSLVGNISVNVNGAIDSIKELTIVTDPKMREKCLAELAEHRKLYMEDMDKLNKLVASEKTRGVVNHMKDVVGKGREFNGKLVELAKAGKLDEMRALYILEGMNVSEELSGSMHDALSYMIDRANSRIKEASESGDFYTHLAMLISFITIIFGISCGIFVRIIITRAFNSCISISETIASGDLTSTISEAGNDEAAQLRRSMSVMQERMRDSLSIITDSVFSITTSSKQLAGSTTEIATATEEVSAQINMIATATEEMSATSMEIAQSVHYVADDATKSMKIIDTNADTMKSTIFIMEDIARRINASAEIISRLVTSSDEIGTIINTIEDIADQTKLLALNAAIEAARAGEHGMGFAVVADEVKALAERTTNATSEIGTMIKTIQKETKTAVDSIEAGVKRAGEGTVEASKSKEALDEMSSRTHSTMEQVNHVATAAEEQNATTREIAENMQGILTAVSETSGRLSEITNVSKVLSKMADDLGSTVKKFRI